MSTVKVVVYRAGRIIKTIERPLREVCDGPAVAFRRQLWRLKNGRIDIDGPSLDDFVSPAQEKTEKLKPDNHVPLAQEGTEQAEVDESDVRSYIAAAPASARLLVEAGPGTGKTEMAARRIANLVRTELSPGQILVLCFSRSAVRTLTRRLGKIVETDPRVVEELRHLSVRTFDSWAFRMLRLLGEAPHTLLTRGHDANVAALTEIAKGPRCDDLRTLMGDRRHFIVDEFQDLPGVRGDLVLALLALMAPPEQPGCGFTILGDPAQAIFGFARGMRDDGEPFPTPLEYWREVCRIYSKELEQKKLTRNYRSDPPLAHMSRTLRAILLSDQPEEEKFRVTMAAVAALPAPAQPIGRVLLEASTVGSRAILTQTNGEALRVLQSLYGAEPDGAAVPVRLYAGGHATLPPAWIGALLRKLRSTLLTRTQFGKIHAHLAAAWGDATCSRLNLPEEDVAWSRLARAAGGSEEDNSVDVTELRMRLSWPDAFPDDQLVAEDGVIVTTVHQSKGMEFDAVTLLGTREGQEDEKHGQTELSGEVGERASVVYVAMTRAARTLDRAPADSIHRAPRHWQFAGGRSRLCQRSFKWINMEMGLRGDIDPLGFADPTLLGDKEGVEELQSFLLAEAGGLAGRKVMLCKQYADAKAVWYIHLQDGKKPGRLMGRTANQLSVDLLKILYEKGLSLPPVIMNLRISGVGTITSDDMSRLGDPERTSGLWLGVGLFGTGDFQLRKAKK
ncbi:UvrD-like helicase C-terminal domain-containing protein [Loktanella atrilutea]|uniref:DNA 3'-5' helicase n=1 Tax=Loktanella atrilutea TaxID=366533 RepID=A0A1M5F181_LOKAT|nr:UvrD-helicase domain-containing protein [Loktanella atrilutea]SHF84991.1 UvrD-like helicase C-terminal domain-containing protein [Loktanella atrilutea]